MTDKLLIYAPVPLYRAEGQLFVERQASGGLGLWADNFHHVTAIMPVIEAAPPVGWVPYAPGMIPRVKLETVPDAYRPLAFARAYGPARAKIGALIDEADYLSFAIGGLIGDWGAVACFTAHAKGRPFAVWTDRVESQVTRLTAGQGRWKARLRKRLTAGPMWALEKAVIRRAALGLFHGRETYETYAPYSRNPHVVHDILLDASLQISDEDMAAKARGAADGPLEIVYAGRADEMKGPLDWLEVLAALQAAGLPYRATWLGDGPLLGEMKSRADALGLTELALPGFVDDRGAVLAALRRAHLFLFCHKTPESPRCLIEALMSGTPIVGYEGAYARDLISAEGGGALVPLGDVPALAEAVRTLAEGRSELVALQERARADGLAFDQDSVFRHRSDVIKAELPLSARS